MLPVIIEYNIVVCLFFFVFGTGGIRHERFPIGHHVQQLVVDGHRSRSIRRHSVADAGQTGRFGRENRATQSGPNRRSVQVTSNLTSAL